MRGNGNVRQNGGGQDSDGMKQTRVILMHRKEDQMIIRNHGGNDVTNRTINGKKEENERKINREKAKKAAHGGGIWDGGIPATTW